MKSIKRKIKIRILLTGLIFGILFVIIGIKAAYLQLYCGPWLSKKAANQYETSYIKCGKRGILYDTNYKELSVTVDTFSVAVYPNRINNVQKTALNIGHILNIEKNVLRKKLKLNKPFVWIKRQVAPHKVKNIKKLIKKYDLKGIDFIPEHKRYYPSKTLAAQVLGFSGIDGKGLEGIEFYYNRYLASSASQFKVLKDAFGRWFETEKNAEKNNDGNNIVLTIDKNIQYIAEKALEEVVLKYKADAGMAVVMVPETGAILSMAHYPFFNPNDFGKYQCEVWRNRIVTDRFEPGSTMKIFLAAAAIDSGYCDTNTIFYCENGKYQIGTHAVHDTHAYNWLSLQEIIKYSSNIGAVKVCERIGKNTIYNAFSKFGFGVKTQIDCPGEVAGKLSHFSNWKKIDAGAISFGQGLSVSAIQLITAACAIANDGILMKPYVVQAILDKKNNVIKQINPCVIRRAVSAKTARKVKKIMQTVVEKGGTGNKAALEGYYICGKTGTAQKFDESGTYAKGKYISSFLGFAPAENPKMAILVVLDEPSIKYYGGIVAAPAFKKIAQKTLDYLNIFPSTIYSKKHKYFSSKG